MEKLNENFSLIKGKEEEKNGLITEILFLDISWLL